MSNIAIIKTAIHEFLTSAEAQVICLRGRWGVGKTYFWDRTIKEVAAHEIRRKHYSYVSLFGINSIEELRRRVFQSAVDVAMIDASPSIESLTKNTAAFSKQFGRLSTGWFAKTPVIGEYIESVIALPFLAVRKSVVCIDDVERRGVDLNIRDLMGVISELKERRDCCVAIIMNDDAIRDDAEKFDLAQYFEKVVDESFRFEPTPDEAAKIAIANTGLAADLVRKYCCELGISNIRIIRKIWRALQRVSPLIANQDQLILQQAAQSLCLFVASLYGRNDLPNVPPIEFIRNTRSLSQWGFEDDKPTDEQKAWSASLDRYGFRYLDAFDKALLEFAQQSRLDVASVEAAIKELSAKIAESKSQKKIQAIWNLYGNSFDENESEVISEIVSLKNDDLKYLSAGNLNSIVDLLKSFGAAEKATDLISRYLTVRSNEPEVFNLTKNPFGDRITDQEIRAAFAAKNIHMKDERLPGEVLLKIARDHGWNPEDIALLRSLSVDEFVEVLRTYKGPDLSRIIRAALDFGRIQGASDDMLAITKSVREALVKIGHTARINKVRVESMYKVNEV